MPGQPRLSNFSAQNLDALPSLARGEVRRLTVPAIAATADSLRGYGHPVADFATAAVTLVTWPQPGWLSLIHI